MSRLQAIKAAERSNDQLGKLFEQMGTAEHPRGKILAAYRQAHRALRDAVNRGAFQEINEIMRFLEVDLKEFTTTSLTKASRIGFELGERQLTEYGVDSVGWEDPGIALMEDVWMNQVRDQANRANALLLGGADPSLILGGPTRKGIVEPNSVVGVGARWLGIAVATTWKGTVGRSSERAGIAFLRQAIAAVDHKTTNCCLEVHGQTVGMDEPFHLTGTPRFADEIQDPPFHDYCRTSQVLVRPSEADDELTRQMEGAAALELEYREEEQARIAELKQKLVKLGAVPDGRGRATDTDEIKRLRGELIDAKKRPPISPADARSRRVYKPPKWKPVFVPPGPPFPKEPVLARPFVDWSEEDKTEAQQLAKDIRRHRRKLEAGKITQEEFVEKAGELIQKHETLSAKYGEKSRFMELIEKKVPLPTKPEPLKPPPPSGKVPDTGQVREQFEKLKLEEKNRIISLEIKKRQADQMDRDYVEGRITDKEFSEKQTKLLSEIAELEKKIDTKVQSLLKLPEGVKGVKFKADYSRLDKIDEKDVRKGIQVLEERIVDRSTMSFGIGTEFGGRSRWTGSEIVLGRTNKRDIHHEIGHVIEEGDPTIRRIALLWRQNRTEGETAKWMGGCYGKNEVTKKNKFFDKYVGKIYATRDTEVISMGIEYILNAPEKLLKDPEHFDLIVNVMRGTEREWARRQEWWKE